MEDFIIDEIGWHTNVEGSPRTEAEIHLRFRIIIDFLQSKGLTTRVLLDEATILNDDFGFRKSDLTDDGYLLIKTCYDKWLKGLSRGKSPSDLKIFEKNLK